MTNEEAAKILIKAIRTIGGGHDDINQALQIAIYALGNATNRGIQFDKSLEEEQECPGKVRPPHDWVATNICKGDSRMYVCKCCGKTEYREGK